MHLVGHVSHLGGWALLVKDALACLDDIKSTSASLTLSPDQDRPHASSLRDLNEHFNDHLTQLGWESEIRVTLQAGKRTAFSLDFIKDRVGLELAIGRSQYLLSALYASLPLAFHALDLRVAVILVPTRSARENLPVGVTNFEFVAQLLQEIPIHSIKYPFVILGLSNEPYTDIEIELTSELDQYLITALGAPLAELIALGERPQYDFKVQFPSNNTLAKEACAFANYKSGGLLIIGVADDGQVLGVPTDQVDELQLRVTNVVRDRCDPPPELEFRVFPSPIVGDSGILTIRVLELQRKPCTMDGRVFVRVGPSARPANADEIRRLVIS